MEDKTKKEMKEINDWILCYASEMMESDSQRQREILRCMFTTYCYMFGIDADTCESDNFCMLLYQVCFKDTKSISYDDWESFMYEYIV